VGGNRGWCVRAGSCTGNGVSSRPPERQEEEGCIREGDEAEQWQAGVRSIDRPWWASLGKGGAGLGGGFRFWPAWRVMEAFW
jgi:hypothetical protein